ncbi:Transaldolase [Schizosaccharomyces pombe]|uniref:Transaldolase n=1 Tax=Schizosaccharomyces pombe (strain 972 / ATCC 24843) TaxID=284812 RepID=TAL1_SCHPO|nr:putative transaldolase [Schizosaccharomyces pombe]O42700.2 RecName: Full=Transaldolase [Schizosaccharomyces pombe 972h-]CAA18994.1 transaldolase (predicted) [Schizosaccharomyces pombe]|eukprot:NP_001342725.1 putative transaldolase [Schizosaccharomyces pombe]
MSSLEQLKATGTVVVSDTGDFESIAKYKPQDATTNPSLILAASKKPQYAALVDAAVDYAKAKGGSINSQIEIAFDRLLIEFGTKILAIVPGRVSTEVDARYSFDTQTTIEKARHLIKLYEAEGIGRERVLIKIASTYEGIQAAKQLEEEGIHCNLTLLFSFVQAVACAEANVTLISPFVGRILDFYKAKNNRDYTAQEDPGVVSVSNIFNYYKKFGYKTIVMGASFRNVGEIKELAGVDFLTISPALLEQLNNSTDAVPKKLDASKASSLNLEKVSYLTDEPKFRFDFNNDEMAVVKLSTGIAAFAKDADTLRTILKAKLEA